MWKAKYLIIIFVLTLSPIAFGETLVSKNFTIKVERQCSEGEVTCNDVKFIMSLPGIDKSSVITGKMVHSKCADGTTPCGMQGYKFYSGGGTYFLNNSGFVTITDKEGNILLAEQGKWQ